MTLQEIIEEYERNGRLSRRAVTKLRHGIRSDDPFSAITVAVDTGTQELAEAIADCLSSQDAMVRWNAAAALFTRLRLSQYADRCYEMAATDPDELVKNVCLVGAGELLPLVSDRTLRLKLAQLIHRVFTDESAFPEDRTAAYEAILAAQDVLPADRAPAGRIVQIPDDIDQVTVAEFRNSYLVPSK